MKLFIVTAAVFFSFILMQEGNPLKNTKWDGANGLQVYFTASDTVKLSINDKLLTSALYKVKDSVLTWRDYVPGEATCDTSIRGNYIFHIKDDVLTLQFLYDRCDVRANILQTLLLTKH